MRSDAVPLNQYQIAQPDLKAEDGFVNLRR
jgi:hypothetical protein